MRPPGQRPCPGQLPPPFPPSLPPPCPAAGPARPCPRRGGSSSASLSSALPLPPCSRGCPSGITLLSSPSLHRPPSPPSLHRWGQLSVSFRFAPAFIFLISSAPGVARSRYFLRLRSAIADVQEGGEGGKSCWQPRVPPSALPGLTWLQQPEVVGDKKGESEHRSCCRCLTLLRTCCLCCRAGWISACVTVCR